MKPMVQRDIPMATRDGLTLRSDVYADAEAPDPRPVLLVRTPYDKGFAQLGIYPHPLWLVEQGFIVVIQDVRGRYASEGDFSPFRHEALDGYDAVEWAARLPGSNGRVGMYGASYTGATQLLAVASGAPSLRAVAPAVTSATYGDGWFYEGGAFHLAFGAYWAAQLGEETFRRRGDAAGAARCRAAMRDLSGWLGSAAPSALEPIHDLDYYRDWLAHPPESPFWSELSALEALRSTTVAGLHIAGWFDIFLAGSLNAFRTMQGSPAGDDQHLIVGAWSHWPWGTEASGAMTLDPVAAGDLARRHVDFFHRYLGTTTGTDEAPQSSIEVFPVLGERWLSLPVGSPYDEVADRVLHLTSDGNAGRWLGDGRLVDEAPPTPGRDYTSYHGRAALPSAGGHSCVADQRVPLMGPADRTALDRWYEVLVYRSEPAGEDVVIGGAVEAHLQLSSTSAVMHVHVALSVESDQGVMAVAEGIARVRFPSHDLAAAQAVTVSLREVVVQVRAGQRLRVEVSGGSFPIYPRETNSVVPWQDATEDDMQGATLVVHHGGPDGSRVTIGGRS